MIMRATSVLHNRWCQNGFSNTHITVLRCFCLFLHGLCRDVYLITSTGSRMSRCVCILCRYCVSLEGIREQDSAIINPQSRSLRQSCIWARQGQQKHSFVLTTHCAQYQHHSNHVHTHTHTDVLSLL